MNKIKVIIRNHLINIENNHNQARSLNAVALISGLSGSPMTFKTFSKYELVPFHILFLENTSKILS